MRQGAAEVIRSVSAENSTRRRKAVLARARTTEGLGKALFEHVADLLGKDPSEAGRFASLASSLTESDLHRGYAYRTLAVEARIRGRWNLAAEHFIAAGALGDSSRRAEMSVGAIDCLARAGKVPAALALADELSQSTTDRLTLGRIALNAGNAALWVDDYATAQVWFERALQHLPKAQTVLRASATVGVSTANLYGGNPREARSLAEQAHSLFLATEQPAHAQAAQMNVCAADNLLGRADRALPALLALADAFEPESAEWARTQELIGDAFTQLNRFEDAILAHSQALAHPALTQQPLNRAMCHFSIGHALILLHRKEEAILKLRQARRIFRRVGNQVWAEFALARELEISANPARVRRWQEPSKSPYVEARRRLLQARTFKSFPDLAAADNIIETNGYRALQWEACYVRAQISEGESRLLALREMAQELIAFRLTQDSRLANLRFFGDKYAALQLYMAELIERGLTDELIETLRRSRSVALVNELGSASGTQSQSETFLKRLQEVRDALAEEMRGWPQTDLERRVVPESQSATLSRSWTELLSLLPTVESLIPQSNLPVIYGETGDGFFTVRDRKLAELPGKPSQIKSLLRWLRFELEAPRLNRSYKDPDYIEFALELFEALGSPEPGTLNPDGLLWEVPWPVLFHAAGYDQEVALTLGPWDAPPDKPLETERVALWTFAPEGLPHVNEEARAFTARFPRAQVCRTRAEVERCLAGGPLDLLHVAGHVATHPTNPSFSSLLLEDGHFPAGWVALSGLKVDTVVLSACDTGRMDHTNRTEPDGWVRAFLGLGARAVIGSQWPLDDEAGTCFFKYFYESGHECDTLKEALKRARSETRKRWPHPYFWAQMNLYGGLPR